jgi:hypothetical protein
VKEEKNERNGSHQLDHRRFYDDGVVWHWARHDWAGAVGLESGPMTRLVVQESALGGFHAWIVEDTPQGAMIKVATATPLPSREACEKWFKERQILERRSS